MTMTRAEADVLAEREKQRAKWSDAHDDGHADGELGASAAVLVHPLAPRPSCGCREAMCEHWSIVPDPEPVNAPDWAYTLRWGHDRRRQLVIGAALALAEIERLDREEVP